MNHIETLHIAGIGLRGPGLSGWTDETRSRLTGESLYLEEAIPPSSGAGLPTTERRRATRVTRLALDVAREALGGEEPDRVATVFTSSGGEVEVIHQIFTELAHPQPALSPTQFHNSVHNTAAGYWGIATRAHAASNSISGFDDSFAVGLLEAVAQCRIEKQPVLLVAYDYPPLFPLSEARPLTHPFAAGFLLRPEKSADTLARLAVELAPSMAATALKQPDLERLRQGNPAARSLPLLAALAKAAAEELVLGCGPSTTLRLHLEPAT